MARPIHEGMAALEREVDSKRDLWVVGNAAILMLIEAGSDVRRAYFDRLASVDLKGNAGFSELVKLAEAGKLTASLGLVAHPPEPTKDTKKTPPPIGHSKQNVGGKTYKGATVHASK